MATFCTPIHTLGVSEASYVEASLPPSPTVSIERVAGSGDVLSTAFLAKNLTLVCSQQDRWFAQDTRTDALDGVGFADHVEGEVLERLSQADSGLVVIRAANASRAVSLGLIEVMGNAPPDEQSQRLRDWCETTAKPLVRGILAQHGIRHDLYERMLAQTKQ